MKPEVGSKAPDFTLPVVGGEFGQEGRKLSLAELQGSWVVIYFYPKDNTPGCTKQACELRDSFAEVSQKALILGASPDDLKSHQKFVAGKNLPFGLLVDEEKTLVNDYGVWVEKSLFGNKYMGTERSTFVIDPQGKVAAVLEKVSPGKHLSLLMKTLSELGA